MGISQAKRRWTASRLQAVKNATTGAGAAPERNMPAARGIETTGPDGVTMPAADARKSPFHPDSSPSAAETHSVESVARVTRQPAHHQNESVVGSACTMARASLDRWRLARVPQDPIERVRRSRAPEESQSGHDPLHRLDGHRSDLDLFARTHHEQRLVVDLTH